MALARVVYTQSESGNTNFTVPFPYISRDHVKVTVNGAPASFTWINTNTVQITPAPALGAVVEIRRVTERRNLLVDFKDGSTITETDLDLLALQNFYLSQEADDLAEESNAIANAAASTANRAAEIANKASSTAASAVATVNSANDTANTALANANNAVSTANDALSIANTASSSASTAVATAKAAQTAANSAISTANSAKDTANSAISTANSAKDAANSALSKATNAVSTADTAAQNAATALSKADTALANSEKAISTANTALTRAASAEAAATTASNAAQSAATSAATAVDASQRLETRFNEVLESVQQISGADLSDFTKNSSNLAYLTDKAAARANLGLGTAATADLTTSVIDTTPGRVLKFGDFGVGSGVHITGENLDTLTKAGFYFASNCTNTPESRGGVFVSGTPAEPVQLWVGNDSGRIFVRKFQAGVGWSPWQEIYHSGNIDTANAGTATKLQAARTITIGNTSKSFDGSANVSWSLSEILGIGVPETAKQLGDSVDLNTIQTPGFYLQPWNAQAANGTNYPVPYAGALMVLKNAGGVTQIYCPHGSYSGLFIRTVYGSSWSPWQEYYHSGNINTANAGTAARLQTPRTITIGNTSKAFDGSANVSWSLDEIGAAGLGNLADGTDLNTVVKPGFYRINAGHGNAPAGVDWGQLIVARGSGSTTILQILTGFNNGEIYWRQGIPPNIGGWGSWGPWYRFYHSGNIDTASFVRSVSGKAPGDNGNVDVTWNDVSGKPSTFTPSEHTHSPSQISPQGEGSGLDADTVRGYAPNTTGGLAVRDGTLQSNLNAALLGGMSVEDFPIRGTISNSTSLDTVVRAGMYRIENHPQVPTGFHYGQMLVLQGGGDTVVQVAFPLDTSQYQFPLWRIGYTNGQKWTSWNALGNTNNIIQDGKAPGYLCRAWCVFDGFSGKILRAGNVSSLVRNDMGTYTMTFSVPMPSQFYVLVGGGRQRSNGAILGIAENWSLSASQVQFSLTTATGKVETNPAYVAVFC